MPLRPGQRVFLLSLPQLTLIPLIWFMICIQAPRIMRRIKPEGPRPVRSCHQEYVFMCSRSRMSLITLNWVLTSGESTLTPWPSSAAITSRASSYLPLRMSSRGESGRKGHMAQMQRVKKIWKARGKRQAMSRGAKAKPKVSQFEMLKPLQVERRSVCNHSDWRTPMDFHVALSSLRYTVGHLNDHQFPAGAHLARLSHDIETSATHSGRTMLEDAAEITHLSLPDTCSSGIHPGPKPSHHTANIHLTDVPARGLDDRTQRDDTAAEQNLSWSAEHISRDDRAERAHEAPDVIYRSHGALGVGGGLAEGLQEVLVDDDVAEDALVWRVEVSV